MSGAYPTKAGPTGNRATRLHASLMPAGPAASDAGLGRQAGRALPLPLDIASERGCQLLEYLKRRLPRMEFVRFWQSFANIQQEHDEKLANMQAAAAKEAAAIQAQATEKAAERQVRLPRRSLRCCHSS